MNAYKNLILFVFFISFSLSLFAQQENDSILTYSLVTNKKENQDIKNNIDKENKRPKVGLVLSGGGAKGFADIEIIKMIEKAGVKIDYIGGTSMGAMIGAMYAAGYSPDEMLKILREIDFFNILFKEKERDFMPLIDKAYRDKYIVSMPIIGKYNIALPQGLSKGQKELQLLSKLLVNVNNIEDHSKLPIPFICFATDVNLGKSDLLDKGFLPLNVSASGAYPSLIESVKIGDKYYIDGGLYNNFPVKDIKDRKMDIIIGVDLSHSTHSEKIDANSSILNVLKAIFDNEIEKRTREQRKEVDVLIRPNFKDYGVTDFDKLDSILSIGKIEAKKHYKEFVKIAKMQGYDSISNPYVNRKPYISKNLFNIKDISIEGETSFKKSYYLKKLGIKLGEISTLEEIDDGISSLFSTNNFNKVYYKLDEIEKNIYNLILFVDEKKENEYIKLSLHYDNVMKEGILVNLTSSRFLLNSSSLSIDAIFGTNPRYNINYFIDNGIYPSLGINNYFNYIFLDLAQSTKDAKYNFQKIKNFVTQIFIQSTLKERASLNLGIEHSIINLKSNINFYKYFPEKYSILYIPYFSITADTRNNPNYPFSGTYLKIKGQSVIYDNNNKNNKYGLLNINFNYYQPIIKDKLSLGNEFFLGTAFNKSLPIEQQYHIGGYFEQDLINFKKFIGIPFAYDSSNNLFYSSFSLNYRATKNNYFGIYTNFASLSDALEKIKIFKPKYNSFGVKYGFDSYIGPLNLIYSYSPSTKNNFWNLSIGFWF